MTSCKTLISFIGKGTIDTQADNNKSTGSSKYRKTKYSLNGKESDEVTFVCKALYDFILPDKIIIIGTTGSSWNEVVYNFLPKNKVLDSKVKNALLEMENIANSNTVDQICKAEAAVDVLSKIISSELNKNFLFKIFDDNFGARCDENFDNNLFENIIESIEPDDIVSLDVTHSYRFIPMYSLMAVQYLTYIKGIRFEKIYCGWYENNLEVKPIRDLSGILKLNKWITSYAKYEVSNDISLFCPFIKGEKYKRTLETASFDEKVTYASKSIKILKDIGVDDLVNDVLTSHDPVLRTLTEPLKQKLSYIDHKSQAFSIYKLAEQFFSSNDYFRAIIYLHESLMTLYSEISVLKYDLRLRKNWSEDEIQNIIDELKDINNNITPTYTNDNKFYKIKEYIESVISSRKSSRFFDIYDYLAKNYFMTDDKYRKIFEEINDLRNAVAHGNPKAYIINKYYSSEMWMKSNLNFLFKRVKTIFLLIS